MAEAKALLLSLPRLGPPMVIYDFGDEGKVLALHTGANGPDDFRIYAPTAHDVPYHDDLFHDLERKRLSDVDAFERLLEGIERIGEDESPVVVAQDIGTLRFPQERFTTTTSLALAQLLMVEQEFNYGPGRRHSVFDRPREFLLNYLRLLATGGVAIEVLCERARRWPPDQLPRFRRESVRHH